MNQRFKVCNSEPVLIFTCTFSLLVLLKNKNEKKKKKEKAYIIFIFKMTARAKKLHRVSLNCFTCPIYSENELFV